MSSIEYRYDDETGEVVTYHVNDETGESSLGHNFFNSTSTTDCYQRILSTPTKRNSKFPYGHFATNSRQFQSLKANIIAGSNTISYRMLLMIPTIMLFSGVLSIVLIILEIFLHVRCHKKNKNLDDHSLYYRSPFHVITSVFCGVCRDMDAASRVGQLQDQRRDRYAVFRGIARWQN